MSLLPKAFISPCQTMPFLEPPQTTTTTACIATGGCTLLWLLELQLLQNELFAAKWYFYGMFQTAKRLQDHSGCSAETVQQQMYLCATNACEQCAGSLLPQGCCCCCCNCMIQTQSKLTGVFGNNVSPGIWVFFDQRF